MANFTPSKKTAQDFNGGVEYQDQDLANNVQGDYVQAETVNNLVESALYTQNYVESGITEATEIANSAKQTAEVALSQVNQVLEDKTLLPDVIKNYYNLGAYDTYVDNGDGTVTIQRKTGYFTLKTSSMERVAFANGTNVSICVYKQSGQLVDPNITFGKICGVSNINIPVKAYSDYWCENLSIALSNHKIVIGDNSCATLDDFRKKYPIIYIQYVLAPEYQYEERVIKNQPIHTFNQDKIQWVNEEFEKSLNLFNSNLPFELGGWDGQTGQPTTPSDETYRRYPDYIKMVSGTICSQNPIARVFFYDKDKTFISSTVDRTFTVPQNACYIRLAGGGKAFVDYILTKGQNVHSYQPYNGDILHEKDVPIYFTAETTSPAEINGGDWESLGSFTTSGTTIYAWRKL